MRAAGILFTILLVCSTAQADTIFSNVAAVTDGSDHIRAFGPLSNSFSTNSIGGELTDLKLVLSVDDPESSRRVRIVLFSDNSGSPGARITRLGSLAESFLSVDPGVYDVNLRTNPVLAPNTRYWIGLRNGPATLWAWSLDVRGIGVGSELFANNSGIFSDDPNGPYQMSVTTVEVPASEPDTLILLIAGVGAVGMLLIFPVRR